MRNTLNDLHNGLFEIFERLSDEDLSGARLTEEVNRARVMADIASTMILNGNLMLKVAVAKDNFVNLESSLPKVLEDGK